MDSPQVAALWWHFVRARCEVDRSLRLKDDCDFPRFVERELRAPGTFCWLAEHRASEADLPVSVGCVIWYLENESADPLSPFEPRRCGKVLGLYVDPAHRSSGSISLLMDACIRHAESLGVTDIDVLISAEQTGLHTMIGDKGLSRAAIQFTRHYGQSQGATTEVRAGARAESPRLPTQMERASRLGHRFPGRNRA